MSELDIVGMGLGGSSILVIILWFTYKAITKNCSSHVQLGESSFSLDFKDIKDIVESVNTPEEREKIKKEVQLEMKATLHKVKSRLTNKLTEVREKATEEV